MVFAVERQGCDHALSLIALRCDYRMDGEKMGKPELYEQFQELHAGTLSGRENTGGRKVPGGSRTVGRPLLVRTGGYPAWVLRPGDGDDEEPAAVLGAEFQKWFGSPRVANVTP
jgi:hypothetical protein